VKLSPNYRLENILNLDCTILGKRLEEELGVFSYGNRIGQEFSNMVR